MHQFLLDVAEDITEAVLGEKCVDDPDGGDLGWLYLERRAGVRGRTSHCLLSV